MSSIILGLFDSGVGGLTVLRTVRTQLPQARLLYFGDTVHIPYGPRPLVEVQAFAEAITRFLLAQGAQAIVVACNTASAAALKHLRAAFPQVPFVGMEPALKPAAEQTQTGVVGVLATPATFQGELFNSVVARFAQGVRVLTHTCPGLVQQIEAGELDSPRTEAMLREWLAPMLAQHIDALVLGCTHYPLVAPLLTKICGPSVRLIDPAPAVARQVARIAESLNPTPETTPACDYWASGDLATFQAFITRLGFPPGPVRGAVWQAGQLRPH